MAGRLVRNGLNDGDQVLGAVRELTHQEGDMILPVAALRHVERHAQHGDRPAILRADELRAAEHPADLAVRSDDAKLLVEAGGFSLRGLIEGLAECCAVVGMHEAQDFIGPAGELIAPAPEDSVHALGPGDFVGGQIPVPCAEAGDVERQRQALMGFAYALFVALRGFAALLELLAGVVQGGADGIGFLQRDTM